MHANVHRGTIYNSQALETTQVPITDDWFKKMKYEYVYVCVCMCV